MAVKKNNIIHNNSGLKSIPASLEYPARFKNILRATLTLKDAKNQDYSHNLILIEEGKSVAKSVIDPKNGFLIILFRDLSYKGYDIDEEGKIIFLLKEGDFIYQIRVSASEFLKKLIEYHE